jgi:hypothetical protein
MENKETNIIISFDSNESIKEPLFSFKDNGDIYIRGKLVVESDKEIADAMQEYFSHSSLLLNRSIMALDDFLNAGCKETRRKAAENAKLLYKEYYGMDYVNRNDR